MQMIYGCFVTIHSISSKMHQVPDLEEYWGAHRVVTCDAPVGSLQCAVAKLEQTLCFWDTEVENIDL